jgi:hypothetical protein
VTVAEDTTGPSAAAATTTPTLFVRQSSGLVRNVSVTNALFFNVAAFVGVGLTLYPIFYSLAFVPVWRAGPFRLRLGGDHRRPAPRTDRRAQALVRGAGRDTAPLGGSGAE